MNILGKTLSLFCVCVFLLLVIDAFATVGIIIEWIYDWSLSFKRGRIHAWPVSMIYMIVFIRGFVLPYDWSLVWNIHSCKHETWLLPYAKEAMATACGCLFTLFPSLILCCSIEQLSLQLIFCYLSYLLLTTK